MLVRFRLAKVPPPAALPVGPILALGTGARTVAAHYGRLTASGSPPSRWTWRRRVGDRPGGGRFGRRLVGRGYRSAAGGDGEDGHQGAAATDDPQARAAGGGEAGAQGVVEGCAEQRPDDGDAERLADLPAG